MVKKISKKRFNKELAAITGLSFKDKKTGKKHVPDLITIMKLKQK